GQPCTGHRRADQRTASVPGALRRGDPDRRRQPGIPPMDPRRDPATHEGAPVTAHRSRLCHIVIDCDDLDRATAFWCAALDATAEGVDPQSTQVYRRLRLPDSEIRVLLQHTTDQKCGKERMHLDLEADDVEA